METLSMLGMAPSVPSSSSATVLQLKTEDPRHGDKVALSSEVTSVAAAVAVSESGTSTSASEPHLIPIQPQFIVSLPSSGPSPETAASESDEPSEPKRLRVAEDEEWTSDS